MTTVNGCTIEKDAGASILRRRFKRKTYTEEGIKIFQKLQRLANSYIEIKLTDDVTEALHGVPLAIEQAGAYLQFYPRLTTKVLETFLTKLSSPSIKADILAKIPKRSVWFYEKHRSVIDTFSLLKVSLVRKCNDALNILLISAFLAQGEIPIFFLTQSVAGGVTPSLVARIQAACQESQGLPFEILAWLQSITADEVLYYKALETLEQFCCIKRHLASDESTYIRFSMHNVIRHWSQETLDLDKQAAWSVAAAFQLSRCLQLDSVSPFIHEIYSRHVGHAKKVLRDPEYSSLIRYPTGPFWSQAFTTA